jgi:hypothetical protein
VSNRVAVSRPFLVVPASLCAALAVLALGSASAVASPPSHKQAIDAPNGLNAVSCVPDTTDCVVSDSKGNALYSTDVTTSADATWTPWAGPAGAKPSQAIACPSSSVCVLADGVGAEPPGGNMYYATSLGGTWKEAFTPVFGVDSVSCASTSLCVDGQAEGFIRYSTDPASEQWEVADEEHIGIGSGTMNAVDCLTASFCAVVSSEGDVYIANTAAKIKEETGWTSTDIDGTTALHGIACIAKTSCVAIDGTGNVLHLTINASGEAEASRDDIDGTNSLSAITCTGFTCATVDKQGNVFVSGNGGASWAQSLDTGTDLTSVSCASSALCVTADTTGNVTAFTAPMYVLSVFISGEGEVTSTPAGLTCTTGECSHEFEGAVTLTATPKPGYVLAGWLGCRHTGPDTCEIATPTSEVTAVFLQAGEKGEEGKAGKEGSTGKEGATGKEGQTGAAGPAGEKGANGTQGEKGPAGPTGAQGSTGPAGKIELVTCKTVKGKQRCTTKLVSGTAKFTTTGLAAQATLSRHGVVYAAGTARTARGHLSLRLEPLRSLRPGKYTLTLVSGTGKHEKIRSESFTLS